MSGRWGGRASDKAGARDNLNDALRVLAWEQADGSINAAIEGTSTFKRVLDREAPELQAIAQRAIEAIKQIQRKRRSGGNASEELQRALSIGRDLTTKSLSPKAESAVNLVFQYVRQAGRTVGIT